MMSEDKVLHTTFISLWIQAITGIVVIYGVLFLNNLYEKDKVLYDILLLEGGVQIVEFLFYIYISQNFTLQTIAQNRYYDWVITTPIMLFSLMLYFHYETSDKIVTINNFISEYKSSIIYVLSCNFLMLVSGYLGEVGIIDIYNADTIGFIAFALAFREIYDKFAYKLPPKLKIMFYIVVFVWMLYGIGYLLSPHSKNIMYNGLDIIAKNVFGLYLVAKLSQVQKKI